MTILSFMRPSRGHATAQLVEPADAEPQPDLRAAIHAMSQRASVIGRESAEVRGLIDDSSKASERGVQSVAALTGQVKDINLAQDGISSASAAGLGSVDAVRGAGRQLAGFSLQMATQERALKRASKRSGPL